MAEKMVLFEIDFTVKSGNLEFKDRVLIPARDKKAARAAFLQITSKAGGGIKGIYGDRHIIYDMSQSTLEVTKVTPFAS